MDIEELIDAWKANCAINHELLGLCGDDDMELKPGKGKTIRSNFVHIIGVRRAHLEERLPKETATVPKLDWKSASREEISEGLKLTDSLMAQAFRKQDETGKPARWTAPSFFAYSVAHEAHHRSQIEIALRLGDRELEDRAMYGFWESFSSRST